MKKTWEMSRRTVLRGLGAAVALPLLDAMAPSVARAQAAKVQRLVWIYLPNGIMPDAPFRSDNEPPPSYLVNTLGDISSDVSLVSGLTNQYPNVSVSHFAYWAPLLNGSAAGQPDQVPKTFDQYIAPLQPGTRLPTTSINAFPDPSPYAFNAIQANNASWKGPDHYVPAHTDPRDLYNALFAGGTTQEVDQRVADQLTRKRSILHYCMEDIRKVRAMTGRDDRVRVDEFLEGINELDQRIRAQLEGSTAPMTCAAPDLELASTAYPQRLQLFYDLLYFALKCDLTRVSTFLHASENTSLYNRSFVPGLVTNTTWHINSHYATPGYSDADGLPSNSTDESVNRADFAKILAWHNSRIVDFVKRLKATSLPNGQTLLDECAVVWGSCLGESTAHQRRGLFWTLAGSANGAFRLGQRLQHANQLQISNLWLTLLRGFGVNLSSLGDGDQVMSGLLA